MATVDGSAPRARTFLVPVPGNATAATDQTNPVVVAPFAGRITSVAYIPLAAITGAATNFRRMDLVNKGQNGAGSTVSHRKDYDNGNNATAFTQNVIPANGVAANQVVATGDVLAWFSDAQAAGMVDPGGLVVITITNDA